MATAQAQRTSPFGLGISFRSYSEARLASPLKTIERELQRSAQTSQYIQRLHKLETLIESTRKLSQLPANWDSYGALPPSQSAISEASKFIFSCARSGLLPIRALPSAEGGVALRFSTGDKRALVEFLNSGSVEVMLYDEAGDISSDSEKITQMEDLANTLQSHLTR